MKSLGIQNGLVDAGGDLFAWGKKPNYQKWKIGIANPENEDNLITHLELENTAIVTSGNSKRYAMIDGKRYTHIIDPRTGYPATGLKSVSVICPDAALADALATAIFVMGKEDGLALVNQLEAVECYLIDEQNEVFTSKNIDLNINK